MGITIVCHTEGTRSGFKHVCKAVTGEGESSYTVASVKVCYINRTWEARQYDTCKAKLMEELKKKDIEAVVIRSLHT